MKQKSAFFITIALLVAVLTSCSGGAILAAGENSSSASSSPDTTEQTVSDLATSVQNAPQDAESAQEDTSGAESRPAGWTEETHSSSADPDYDTVFPQDEVNRIDIVIDPDNWQAMLDDMTGLTGEFGTSSRGTDRGANDRPADPPAQGEAAPQGDALPQAQDAPGEGGPPQEEGAAPADGMPAQRQAPPGGDMQAGARAAGPGAMGAGDGGDENPIWVPGTVEFEDSTWTNVGIRFKGNSSLRSTWTSGNMKLPFKLDFDEFEDEYPEIDDQRFYGFKQLTLSSNYDDNSLLREKVVADIFRDAGVPSAYTAFYRVYVDYGEGPVYFGLYTMVEVIDDTVIEEQFDDDSGNVYKPEGRGANFAQGTFTEAGFDKETNEDDADWSDILALFDALHSPTRTSDPAAWRESLESVFDVDGFLKWLAVNTVVQNWDTYGGMAHNYYLYNDPTTGLLTWIPWDNNEALSDGKMRGTRSLDLTEVSADWPLIRYLIDDPVYQTQYAAYVEETVDGVFEPTAIAARYEELHDLIQPYVTGEDGENPGYTFLRSPADFETALDELVSHVSRRYEAVGVFLSEQ